MKKIVLIGLGLLTLAGLGAQTKEENLKAYVSKLETEVKDSYIILTWQNDKDAAGSLQVFVHTAKIDSSTFSSARKVATLDGGKESFLFYPADKQYYYFAVNYTLSNGEPNKVFVDYRNVTVTPIRVSSLGTEQELATTITLLTAKDSGGYISVTFLSSRPSRELILYRSTSPILNSDELLAASFYIALDADTALYKDYPIAEIDYYYAVLDAGMVKIGQIGLVKYQNATALPVRIKSATSTREAQIRESQRTLPLPLLTLSADLESGAGLVNSPSLLLPAEKSISAETRAAVETLKAGITLTRDLKTEIEVLEIDTITDITGEAYTLQTIIRESVLKLQYGEAETKLAEFLRIKRAVDVEARTRFYQGQLYYFQEKYDQALLAFLLASELYYTRTQAWVDSCFQHLVE